jgi:hypothetical protein
MEKMEAFDFFGEAIGRAGKSCAVINARDIFAYRAIA